MIDAIADFVKSVNSKQSKILSTPNFVFLCGGPTAKEGIELSARDHFHRYLRKSEPDISKRVRLAETINNWFDHDTFSDLLELEEYLADLCDLIFIFVESPGSIAELGAFTSSQALRPKTLAVLNAAYAIERTFIADGPIRRIRNEDTNLVRYYDWNAEDLANPATEAFYDMDRDLTGLLKKREGEIVKEKTITLSSPGHIMLMIADLVDMIGITMSTELIECLSLLDLPVDRKQMDKYISILDHSRLIKVKRNSNQTYLIGRGRSFIAYSFRAGARVNDRTRIKTLIREALTLSDERRIRVLKTHLLAIQPPVPSHA
jgi:hypothetical protein